MLMFKTYLNLKQVPISKGSGVLELSFLTKMNCNLDNLIHLPYSRFEIDKEFIKVKATMHQAALIRGNSNALYKDCYTGKILNGGDPYDYEHIYGSEWILPLINIF